MTKHRYTQSKPPVLAAEATEVSVDTDDPVGSASENTQEPKVVEVDTNEILVALLDQFKRFNSVLEKQGQAQIQQAATLMQLTDGIKAINDRLKKPSFM
jgi:hypothetical protein